jgi:hypothetical protein
MGWIELEPELARACGLSVPALRRWVGGGHGPGPDSAPLTVNATIGVLWWNVHVAGFGRTPTERVVIERMRQLRSEGLAYAAIAAELNATGVPTAQGASWHANTVRRILNRENTRTPVRRILNREAFVSSVTDDIERVLDERERHGPD